MEMVIESYLKNNIDKHLIIKPWLNLNVFPVFIRTRYNFYDMRIMDSHCILLEILDDAPSVDQIHKHIRQIMKLTDYKIVLFYKNITRYRRRSLIENRIPFVIENGQMYLPFLSLDIKKADEIIEHDIKKFSTPAQIAFLYFLYNKDLAVNMTEFADQMGLNKMTASRALNELYNVNLIKYEIGGKTGRSKKYRRIKNPDYFLRGKEYLKSPVKKTVFARVKPSDSLIAGLKALSDLSMINPPKHMVMAIDKKNIKVEQLEIIINKDLIEDNKFIEIELWDYNPMLFSDDEHVDLVSLFASLKEETDERIEQALEEVLQSESWYMD